jgi:D-alanine transaminase
MTQHVWLNGEIMPIADARLGVEDRGFQFADGVYEVVRLYDGRPFALDAHLRRLWNSAVDIQITPPLAPHLLAAEVDRLLATADVGDAQLYMQLTRGIAPRDHLFPEVVEPTLLFYLQPTKVAPRPGEGPGVQLLATADDRWKRCWIKSIALLPNVLAKNAAVAAGFDEAAFVDAGFVTEGSATNIFAVVGGKLVTHPVGTKVLPGVTRAYVLECAAELGIEVDERAIREEEAPRADELFVTSTTREVAWVSRWNDIYIGCGRCGRVTAELHRALRQRIRAETSVQTDRPVVEQMPALLAAAC